MDNIDLLRRAVSGVKREHPFDLIAIVVLPEHLHCVWALPTGDAGSLATLSPTRWKKIKAAFSRGLPQGERGSPDDNPGNPASGQYGYWMGC
jgi:putative transposase